jgi:uncharacterized protein YdhG (YjbR/CyaY superfamily)
MAAFTSVEEYLSSLSVPQRAVLQELRRTVNAAAPDATETIAYDMPALRSHGGQFLASYAAYKRHYSLFPASGAVIEALGEELTPYLAGKGTIRFPADKPVPFALVTRIVKIRVAEIADRAKD